MRTSAAPIPPRGHEGTNIAVSDLATAVLALRAAAQRAGGMGLDAASSAMVLGLLEHGRRTIGYALLQATFQADATGIHRLDPETATAIDDLAADPRTLADGSAAAPPERFVPGMAVHRNTAEYLQAHLHISATEARSRLTGARLLIAPAPASPIPADGDEAAQPGQSGAGTAGAAPSFPVLAGTAADGSADVGTVAQLAGRLESLRPRIAARPDAANLNTAIEESLAHEARTAPPRSCHKALSDWTAYLQENGAPITDEEIRAKRGMVYRGFREGCDEYLLRCDPIDSEILLAFAEAWSNPRSDRVPPASASTAGPPSGPGTASSAPSVPAPAPENGQGSPASGNSKATSVTGAPGTAGLPAPEWALALGIDPALAPLSELACGAPAAVTPGASSSEAARRTSPQLLLDAVLAAVSGALSGSAPLQSGGMPVKIGVLIGYRALLGQCEDAGITAHGRPISAANIRRLACNGDILPAVLGTDGEILDLGREARSFSPAQRKAIALRDRGCVIPGCHRPASTSEVHHVVPWMEGGPTSVDNGASLCQHHHLMVHAGLITLKMINGIPYVIAHAGQPRGDPERNLFWHPELRTAGYTPPLFSD
ncbi:DUF222 domain-containing protein [Paeniglutamicibacter sp. ZC-3]|uniref:HNH endonuclease signature motif containing protein n=1 Tax=Paeniglutamicibacter sp. ZC-3 TaxID=2986919 RepID=UPI0021F6F3B3|nr:DUF222 domain-containing protein [Paeniglutamicibacter sp. ZC-3]MCV9995622.1 DUF222 domain-containing protein [Paeniglutamicibacter sp. ZC-3]